MPRQRARLDPAALTLAFAPDGLHGTTSDQVAACAGVAKPTLYAHGGSKDSMFLACVEAEVERLLTAISAADLSTRALAVEARVSALAEAIVSHGRERPAAARLLYLTARHASSSVAREVDAALDRIPARLASILRRDTTAACAAAVAPMLLGAASAVALGGHAAAAARETRGARGDGSGRRLGEAFAALLEPIAARAADQQVQTVGLY